jgi:hypothetical protein
VDHRRPRRRGHRLGRQLERRRQPPPGPTAAHRAVTGHDDAASTFDPSEKVPLIAAYARQRPAAWVDDVHTPHARNLANSRTAPTLLITADPAIGLTRKAIDEVIAWAKAATSR